MQTLAWVYFYASAGVVAVILAAAAIHKMRFSADFITALAGYRLMPAMTLKLWWAVPAVEVMAVIELLFSHAQSRWLSLALFTVYGAAISVNLMRGRTHIECGCGGDRTPIGWGLVLRNGVLAGLALPFAAPVNVLTLSSTLLLAATIAFAVLSYVTANQLFANAAR